jgi:hypothetical protein
MQLGLFADYATSVAIFFRNGQLKGVIVPSLEGQPMTEEVVRKVLEAYTLQLRPYLPEEIRPVIDQRVDDFVPRAVKQIEIDQHMNYATGDTMTLENAEAILVAFVNFACMPMDLGFYTRDLVGEPRLALT